MTSLTQPCNPLQPSATRSLASSLTPAQTRAVALVASGLRHPEVAHALGVDRATVWRWAQTSAFQAAVDTELRDALETTRILVAEGRLTALRFLADSIDNLALSHRERLFAAKALLAACPPPEAAVPPVLTERSPKPLFTTSEARLIAHALLASRRKKRHADLGIADEFGC